MAASSLFLHLHAAALAQRADTDKAPAATPRIGLVLSGGGARGLAHVGVLKVMEELHVPVHCITGTSMGAIVGGAYASGSTAARLEAMVRRADWDDVFRDQLPRTEISIRRKADDYKTLFALEFGVKDGGLVLPKGVVAGIAIDGFFRLLTSQATGIDDFQKLPIPFRAVAADIETGEAVVLERGSIARAMRASMSVPGALAPVEIDGRLLVDGGIANNLPIDLASADVRVSDQRPPIGDRMENARADVWVHPVLVTAAGDSRCSGCRIEQRHKALPTPAFRDRACVRSIIFPARPLPQRRIRRHARAHR